MKTNRLCDYYALETEVDILLNTTFAEKIITDCKEESHCTPIIDVTGLNDTAGWADDTIFYVVAACTLDGGNEGS